jgi:hypothetical protein
MKSAVFEDPRALGDTKTNLMRPQCLEKREQERLDKLERRRDPSDVSERLRRSCLESRRVLELPHLKDLLDERERVVKRRGSVKIDDALVDVAKKTERVLVVGRGGSGGLEEMMRASALALEQEVRKVGKPD